MTWREKNRNQTLQQREHLSACSSKGKPYTGCYDPHTNIIELRQSYNTGLPADKSVLAEELIHWDQWRQINNGTFRWPSNVNPANLDELLAYLEIDAEAKLLAMEFVKG